MSECKPGACIGTGQLDANCKHRMSSHVDGCTARMFHRPGGIDIINCICEYLRSDKIMKNESENENIPTTIEDLGDGRSVIHGTVSVGEPVSLSKNTHEPECEEISMFNCSCYEIRLAYERGRRDAAKAVFALDDNNSSFAANETWIRYNLGRFDMRHEAYLAALFDECEK